MDKEIEEAFDRDCEEVYAKRGTMPNDEWVDLVTALVDKYDHVPYDGPIGDVVEPWKFTPEAREAWEKQFK